MKKKAIVVKNNKKQVKTSNEQKNKNKLSERLENDGVDKIQETRNLIVKR